MRTERFRIQGYRSLRDVSFEPGSLTVLVGPNNAGKSNVLSAIELLKDVYDEGPQRAFSSRGGVEANTFRRSAGTREAGIGFETVALISANEFFRDRMVGPSLPQPSTNGLDALPNVRVRHTFRISPGSFADLEGLTVDAEKIQIEAIWPDRQSTIAAFDRSNGEPLALDPNGAASLNNELFGALFAVDRSKFGVGELYSPSLAGTAAHELVTPKFALIFPVIRIFLESAQRNRVYRLSATEVRNPGPRGGGSQMLPGGDNLPLFVEFLQRVHPELWETAINALVRIAPDIEDVKVTPEYDGVRTLRFAEANSDIRWLAREMSDGTMHALAALSAVVDPRSPLVLLEELENSLHPWAVRVLVDACREATSGVPGKQIVVTTHSPALIDYVLPNEVYVVWRAQGETHLEPLVNLDPDAERLWEQGDAVLSDLIDGGLVRESVPGGVS